MEPPLNYKDLSPEAKKIFDKAQNQKETLFVYDKSEKPPEFHYTDERRPYTIIKNGEKWLLFAYTDAGCSFTAKTKS